MSHGGEGGGGGALVTGCDRVCTTQSMTPEPFTRIYRRQHFPERDDRALTTRNKSATFPGVLVPSELGSFIWDPCDVFYSFLYYSLWATAHALR
jgi:hypothetical protein